jgi:zinc protease
VIWSWVVLATVLAMGAETPTPARPLASPSDLVSVDSSLTGVQRFVLPNGMTVVLMPDFEAPVVGMELSYEVGLRDEPEQRWGLVSVVQSLMLRGTKHVGSGDYDRLLSAVGGRWSWKTGVDRSFFSVTVPSDAIALPLWLWSDQMGFLAETLTDARIAQQVAEIDDDYVRRNDDVPLGHLWEIRDGALFRSGHPYHRAPNRPGRTLHAITVAEVRAFIARHFTPDRARLVLSGAFDPARVRVLVSQYFATLRGTAGPLPVGPRPVLERETHVRVAAHVNLPAVTVAWSSAPEYEPDDAALDAVAALLTGERAGLLRFKLVDQLKIATEVSADQYSRRLGSLFVIKATAAHGHTASELLTAIDGVLQDIRAHPTATYWFVAAVMGIVIDRVFEMQDHAERAAQYARCDEHGLLSTCVDVWLQRYLNLTPVAVATAVARQLPLDRRVVIEIIPSPDASIAGDLRDGSP